MPHIHFLGTCVVEMFGLDADAAYEHAFSHIRELAGLLRNALAQKTKDAYREVYCWQTTCTLELWGKLLGAHADKPVSCHTRHLEGAEYHDVTVQTWAMIARTCRAGSR